MRPLYADSKGNDEETACDLCKTPITFKMMRLKAYWHCTAGCEVDLCTTCITLDHH